MDRFKADPWLAVSQQRHDRRGQRVEGLTDRASVGHDPHRLEAQVQGRLGVGGLTFEPGVARGIPFGDPAEGPRGPGLPSLGHLGLGEGRAES